MDRLNKVGIAGFFATGVKPKFFVPLTKEQLIEQRSQAGQLMYLAQVATRKAKFAEQMANEAKRAAQAFEAEVLVTIEMLDEKLNKLEPQDEHAAVGGIGC